MTHRVIIQSGDANVRRFLDLTEEAHSDYARRCGARYWRFDGAWWSDTPPAWNRFPMALQCFEEGADQVLWLDADTLVVAPEVNVFLDAMLSHESRATVRIYEDRYEDDFEHVDDQRWRPFVMRRTAGGFFWPMDGADQWEGWNDGVLLMNREAYTSGALAHLCECRHLEPWPHHQPTLWELNWLLDYVKAKPHTVAEMHDRFNWQPFNGASPAQYAVIKAWHGLPHEQRWSEMVAEHKHVYR